MSKYLENETGGGKEYFESYSNAAYNVVGLVALIVHGDVLFCMALQALGVGSFVYHSEKSANRKANQIWKFDWWAMAFVNTVIAGILFDSSLAWIVLVAFHILYSYLVLGKLPVFIETGFSALIALIAVYFDKSLATFSLIVVIFLGAFLIRNVDEDPGQKEFHDSIWHSIWHVITAIGFYLAVYLNI